MLFPAALIAAPLLIGVIVGAGPGFPIWLGVAMVGVGRLIGNTDGKISDDSGDKVESGVSSFRENAQAAGGKADDDFETGDRNGGEDGIARHPALVLAHGLGCIRQSGIRHGWDYQCYTRGEPT